jgi:hypothetical protein
MKTDKTSAAYQQEILSAIGADDSRVTFGIGVAAYQSPGWFVSV